MARIQVSDNLVVDTWPGGGPGGEDVIRVVGLQQRDDLEAGVVIVYPREVAALAIAIIEAATELVGE
ncbi:MAG: hypothetical protein JW850_06705 [Thermoflexales bacterium]|nr:hypothetical protein [Thermoflexales bacterium]